MGPALGIENANRPRGHAHASERAMGSNKRKPGCTELTETCRATSQQQRSSGAVGWREGGRKEGRIIQRKIISKHDTRR